MLEVEAIRVARAVLPNVKSPCGGVGVAAELYRADSGTIFIGLQLPDGRRLRSSEFALDGGLRELQALIRPNSPAFEFKFIDADGQELPQSETIRIQLGDSGLLLLASGAKADRRGRANICVCNASGGGLVWLTTAQIAARTEGLLAQAFSLSLPAVCLGCLMLITIRNVFERIVVDHILRERGCHAS